MKRLRAVEDYDYGTMADDTEHEVHGGAKATMDGEESADECEAKLKAFNERADKPSIRNDPKSLVHAIDAFLATSSTAERWWKKHRSKAAFIKLWTDCITVGTRKHYRKVGTDWELLLLYLSRVRVYRAPLKFRVTACLLAFLGQWSSLPPPLYMFQ